METNTPNALFAPSPASEFISGARDTVPLIIGAIPFGIIYGVLAVGAGLSPTATMLMSLLVFAGASQFVAVGLLAQGAGIAVIVLTTFILNIRHALYAASLAPYVKKLSQRWLFPLGFWLTDETYAVVISRYKQLDQSANKHWYYLGSAIAMYSNWQLCTLLGILAGSQLKQITDWGLEFAMVATFIGIIVPMLISRAMLLCALVSGTVALAAVGLPHQLGLITAAFAGISTGLLANKLSPQFKQSAGKLSK